jgi:hypothetical protein
MKHVLKIFVLMLCVLSLSTSFANPFARLDNDHSRPTQRIGQVEPQYRPAQRQGGVLFVEDLNGTFGPPTQPDPVWDGLLTTILGTGNYGWYTTTSHTEDGPPLDTMLNYDLVIWNCYDYWWSDTAALTPNDQNNLSSYMDGGGMVWLIGQDALYSGLPPGWMAVYFHLSSANEDYWWDCPGANVQGLNEIAGYACYNVPDYTSNPFFPDELIPDSYAHGVLEDTDSSKVVGIFYPGQGDWVTAFWAMDLRTCTPANDQEMMVYGMLDAFGVLGIQERPPQEPGRNLNMMVTPDPVVKNATIDYHLPIAGDVKLQVYNNTGQLINTLVDDYKQAGSYTITWDSKDTRGASVSNGVYFIRLTCGSLAKAINVIVVK